jgi:hypothetical protein
LTLFPTTKTFDLLKLKDKFHFITNADATSSNLCSSSSVSAMKVVFGDFSTEWFGQENGLKQGCVFSSTLFSVLMNDLVNKVNITHVG